MFFKDKMKTDSLYTKKVSPPQYLPSKTKPNLGEVFSLTKYTELMSKISRSNVTDEEKEFLKYAATRHIVFNYSLIADYYAHSNKEMQELMEESALVIIDLGDAIANGYVKLSERIKAIMRETGKDSKFTNRAEDAPDE